VRLGHVGQQKQAKGGSNQRATHGTTPKGQG
jgi:hypothetical protein